MQPQYRADIDGLRAVAVLSVMLFHAGFDALGGGFVGVDVFFVISGYLITTIILRELEAGTFSIASFYDHRIRRLFPALFTVIAFCLVAGVFVLTPGDFAELGETVAATTLFASNMLFWSDVGYFDGPAEAKPLLHTWSLAVEEQYYLLYPIGLLIVARFFKGRYFLWIAAVAFASFVFSLRATAGNPATAFYWAPARAWELMLGAVIALGVLPLPRGAVMRNLLAGAGLVMVVASFFLIGSETPFPGVAALWPVVGTALVIHAGAGGGSAVTAALSARPLVFVGLVSYSLYLWHWPLLVFAKYLLVRDLLLPETLTLLALSFVIAVLSWRYVETPIRRARTVGRGLLWVGSGSMMLAVFTVGAGVYLADGAAVRTDPGLVGGRESGDPDWAHWGRCETRARGIGEGDTLCQLGADDASPSFFVWGDSHARAMATGIDSSAEGQRVSGYVATKAGCLPLLGILRYRADKCGQFNEDVLAFIERRPTLQTVVLVGRWALSEQGSRYKREDGGEVTLRDGKDTANGAGEGLADNEELFERGLRRTVDALLASGRRVVLVSQIPEVGYHVPAAYHVALLTGRDVNEIVAPATAEFADRNAGVDALFAELAASPDVIVISPADKLCRSRFCTVATATFALYRDNNHLSSLGALYISDAFAGAFDAGS